MKRLFYINQTILTTVVIHCEEYVENTKCNNTGIKWDFCHYFPKIIENGALSNSDIISVSSSAIEFYCMYVESLTNSKEKISFLKELSN